MSTILSFDHLKKLRNHPYRMGEYIHDERGEVYLVEEVLDLWEEEFKERVVNRELTYNVLWEGELYTESGIPIPAVYEE